MPSNLSPLHPDGLMRRVNILADKSLLAAFVDDTYYIKPQHVQAALRDSELNPATRSGKKLLWGSAAAALLLLAVAAWWVLDKPQTSVQQTQDKSPTLATAPVAPVPAAAPIATQPDTAPAAIPAVAAVQTAASPAVTPKPPTKAVLSTAQNQKPKAEKTAAATVPVPVGHSTAKQTILFEQRLEAGKQLIDQKKAVASIQLYYNETVNPERIEGFLSRADKLGVLSKIFLLPAKLGGKNGMRVIYGAYPSVEAAHDAAKDLPARYKKAFATSTYIF